MSIWVVAIVILFSFHHAKADFDLKCYLKDNCNGKSGGTSSNPSTGGQVKINPSAVPTDAGYGIEGLFYKDEVDVALIRGTGRVGAAISPSNSDETFFGPPGFENTQDLYERKRLAEKYPNQKYTLAAAMNVVDSRGSGLKSFNLKLGAMIKYNKLTQAFTPGAGFNGVLGPITFGASMYGDQTQLTDPYYGDAVKTLIKYQVQTYNVGIFLSSFILDYSHLKLEVLEDPNPAEVTLLTASLLIDKFIITVAKRTEESQQLSYNYETKQLEQKLTKETYFGGVQYRVNKNIMLGLFNNYYMLREYSFSTTFFF